MANKFFSQIQLCFVVAANGNAGCVMPFIHSIVVQHEHLAMNQSHWDSMKMYFIDAWAHRIKLVRIRFNTFPKKKKKKEKDDDTFMYVVRCTYTC